ncbi:MAG: hypothetical protein ACLR7U_02150 [Ruthenibacterium lactatiformans]
MNRTSTATIWAMRLLMAAVGVFRRGDIQPDVGVLGQHALSNFVSPVACRTLRKRRISSFLHVIMEIVQPHPAASYWREELDVQVTAEARFGRCGSLLYRSRQ